MKELINYETLKKRTAGKGIVFDRYGAVKNTKQNESLFKTLFEDYKKELAKRSLNQTTDTKQAQIGDRTTNNYPNPKCKIHGLRGGKSVDERPTNINRRPSQLSYITNSYHAGTNNFAQSQHYKKGINSKKKNDPKIFIDILKTQNATGNCFKDQELELSKVMSSVPKKEDLDELTATNIQLSNQKKIKLAGINTQDIVKKKYYDEVYEKELEQKDTTRSRQMVLKTKKMLAKGHGRDKVELKDMMRVREYVTRQPMIRYVKERLNADRPYI